jgi:hypothetical protein
MPTFRGNRGNLLQHWVLVELLGDIRQQSTSSLCFVDAYSLSPTATRSPKAATDQTAPEFDRVHANLAKGRSIYERAWRSLSQSLPCEYPSSAAFVRYCWEGQLFLLLCEAERATADEIASWLSSVDSRTTSFELHRGDWRERFCRPVPIASAYYISFDPNMYDRHAVRAPKPENMYPEDIARVRELISRLAKGPIIIQLSTYSVNGANSQSDVFDSVVSQFDELGFTIDYVRADNAMMSLIFSRDIRIPTDVEGRFRSWLVGHRHDFGAA